MTKVAGRDCRQRTLNRRSGGKDTAEAKFEAMRQAGIHVAESPASLGSEMVKALRG